MYTTNVFITLLLAWLCLVYYQCVHHRVGIKITRKSWRQYSGDQCPGKITIQLYHLLRWQCISITQTLFTNYLIFIFIITYSKSIHSVIQQNFLHKISSEPFSHNTSSILHLCLCLKSNLLLYLLPHFFGDLPSLFLSTYSYQLCMPSFTLINYSRD